MGATQLSPYYFGLYDTQTGVKIGEPPLPGRGRSRAFCIKRIIPQTDNITNNASSPQPISLLPPSTAFSSPPTPKKKFSKTPKKKKKQKHKKSNPKKINKKVFNNPPTCLNNFFFVFPFLVFFWGLAKFIFRVGGDEK